MRAISITKPGGPDTLVLVEKQSPEPSRGEVRVRIRATAINRADLLQRMGAYPAPFDAPPDIPGLEISGEVEALGPDVQRWKVGDRVFGLVGGGGYAEAVTSHERALAKIPDGVSFEDAAAVPEAFITAYDAMMQANLRTGEVMLVNGCGSGVGTAAIQLGRALGCTVVGTARTADKIARCKALGLDVGVVAENAKFADKIPAPAVILELIGGDYFAEDLRCIQLKGRIVIVGLLAGGKTETDIGAILRKRVQVTGTMLRARPLEEKIAAMRVFEDQVVPLLARGTIKPVIDRVFPLAEAGKAHEHMASNQGFGKIVLTC